jgi:hypothetical protein
MWDVRRSVDAVGNPALPRAPAHVGLLKAFVWPAFLVYEAFKAFGG